MNFPTFPDHFPRHPAPPPHPMVPLIYPLKSTRDLQLTSNCQNKEHCSRAYLNLAGFYTTDLSPFGNSLFLWLSFCPPASAISLDSCIPFQAFHEHLSQCLKCLTCCSFSGNCPAGLSAPSAGFPWMISYSHVAPTLTYDVRPHESPAQTFLHLLYNCLEGRSTCMSYCCLKFSKTELLPLSPPLDLNVAVYQETVLSS